MKRLQGLLMIGVSLIMIGLSITSDYIGDKDCTAAIMLLFLGVWLVLQKKEGKRYVLKRSSSNRKHGEIRGAVSREKKGREGMRLLWRENL